MIKIIHTEESGRGLYATEFIHKGDILMDCELLVLSDRDTMIVNKTELQYYTFKFNETRDCLVLGLGELFNHSDYNNVNFELVDIGDRKVMRFTAKTDIFHSEQLFINYKADVAVDSEEYKKQKSLVG